MTGRADAAVRLAPVTSGDHDWLYHLLVVVAAGRWKFRGATPSPAEFIAQLWTGVHAQFVVVDQHGRRCGLVGAYNTNLVAGHTRLFAVAAPGHGPSVTEGVITLGNWMLDEFELRKIIIEAPEYNLEQFRSVLDHGTVEGRISCHEYWRGRYWDQLIVTTTVERWNAEIRPLARDRSTPARGAAVVPAAAIEELLSELWPLDSLVAVELAAAIEERFDVDVDYDTLVALEADTPATFAEQLAAQLDGTEADQPARA